MLTRLTALVGLTLTLGLGCGDADDGSAADEANSGPGGKADDAEGDLDPEAVAVYEDILGSSNRDHDNIISLEAFSALFRSEMGEMHQDFHSLRRWYLMPLHVRTRLQMQGKDGSQLLQEGDPTSGLEFCAMHGVMIDLLSTNFPCDPNIDRSCLGDFAIETDTVDPEDSVFKGWGSDEELLAQLEARNVSAQGIDRARTAIKAIDDAMAAGAFEDIARDPASGISSAEDAMCLFMQTSLRLGSWEEFDEAQQSGEISSESDARFYRRSTEPNIGIHNSLHGMLMSRGSAIDVGSPRDNLYNSLFWGIHGWVEFKWREARAEWYPNCGDGPGVLWGGDENGQWDVRDDRETIIENCGADYYEEIAKWGLNHGIHIGQHFREPESGTMGAECSEATDCDEGLLCKPIDDAGSLCFADPNRSKTPASPEGLEPEIVFEVDPKDRTDCAEGETDCGELVAELEPGHPTVPALE